VFIYRKYLRAAPFRVKKCKNLNELGYHIFAIDYRGFGDSTGIPSEEGVVNDVLALYNLIMTQNKNTTIYLYGHSLGTAIVTHAARRISENNRENSFSMINLLKKCIYIFF
jgi:abhydrolase domain-containing protein 12